MVPADPGGGRLRPRAPRRRLGDVITLDFFNKDLDASARAGVEITLESAKALRAALDRAIAAAEYEEAEVRGKGAPLSLVRAALTQRWRVGVDSGGTFTDVCLFDEEQGRVEVWKVPSTPDDPSRGIAQGVEEGMRRVAPDAGDEPAAPVAYFGHGTTVATNALIQHRGVQDRARSPPTASATCWRSAARSGPTSTTSRPTSRRPWCRATCGSRCPSACATPARSRRALDEEAVRAAARRLKAAGVQAVAVSFLYGFVRPEHEQRALAILREELPDAFISAGHEIAPEFREFERLSTVVLNAYLGPVMARYIERLSPRLAALGLAATPHLTQSNGGVIGFATAAAMPVRTVLSGPVDRRGRRAGDRPRCRASATSSPSTWAAPRPTWRCCRTASCKLASRSDRARLSDQGADARHPHGRRRRRLDRLYRRRRPAESRAALVRRRSRAGLLRQGQSPSPPSPTPTWCCRP